MGRQKKYYAVLRGRKPGIYENWFGPGGAEEQVRGFADARYRGFFSRGKAETWLRNPDERTEKNPPSKKGGPSSPRAQVRPGDVIIYTDGACRGNPGPGGYGVVIIDGETRRELSRGFRLTTNNRMELLACIAALESLEKPSSVVLHSDSSYVVNGINKGWAEKWRAGNWMRNRVDAVRNVDLWKKLLGLCEMHRVRFVWIRGHAGDRENERCDKLALQAAEGSRLYVDHGYRGKRQEGHEQVALLKEGKSNGKK
ncbi:MAG: ribonuclease HI [Syntrophales bacterium]|jgi:ribonuclease HI|nr:ribonuclease HI [Syntrophales bacterium]MCK9528629.1 ribonuclease HI [Syntrophales bacterium]MDX9923070.1 ribonuclease HI [Syntrophales bacterium]